MLFKVFILELSNIYNKFGQICTKLHIKVDGINGIYGK